MANNFTPVGIEVQVNNNTGFNESDPDVAALSDGRFSSHMSAASRAILRSWASLSTPTGHCPADW